METTLLTQYFSIICQFICLALFYKYFDVINVLKTPRIENIFLSKLETFFAYIESNFYFKCTQFVCNYCQTMKSWTELLFFLKRKKIGKWYLIEYFKLILWNLIVCNELSLDRNCLISLSENGKHYLFSILIPVNSMLLHSKWLHKSVRKFGVSERKNYLPD